MSPIDQLASSFGATARLAGDEATFQAQHDGVMFTVWYRGGRYPRLRVETTTTGPVPAMRIRESLETRRSWLTSDDDIVRARDRAFDAQAIVRSESREAMVRRVLAVPAVRAAVLAAFEGGVTSVTLEPNALRAQRLEAPPLVLEPLRFRATLSALAALRAALPAFTADEAAPRPKPPAWLVRVGEYAIYVVPVIDLVTFGAATSWWPPVRRAEVALPLVVGTLLALATLPLARVLARASGLGVPLVGRVAMWVPCVVALVLTGTLAVNGAGDHSPLRTHAAQVLDRSYGRGTHWLKVRAWDRAGDTYWITAPHRVWHATRDGAWVAVTTHAGRLGIEWVVDVRGAAPAP